MNKKGVFVSTVGALLLGIVIGLSLGYGLWHKSFPTIPASEMIGDPKLKKELQRMEKDGR